MKKVKISDINSILENKNNTFLNLDGINTNEVIIDMNVGNEEIKYNMVYIIAAIISNNYSYLDLINPATLNERNKSELEKLYKFLKNSKYGFMHFNSIRKNLLQFEINADNTNYQVEMHLSIENFCICENFDIIAIDAYK